MEEDFIELEKQQRDLVNDFISNNNMIAFKRIFNNVKSMTKKIPIYIPPNLTCLLSSPLPLFSGLYL